MSGDSKLTKRLAVLNHGGARRSDAPDRAAALGSLAFLDTEPCTKFIVPEVAPLRSRHFEHKHFGRHSLNMRSEAQLGIVPPDWSTSSQMSDARLGRVVDPRTNRAVPGSGVSIFDARFEGRTMAQARGVPEPTRRSPFSVVPAWDKHVFERPADATPIRAQTSTPAIKRHDLKPLLKHELNLPTREAARDDGTSWVAGRFATPADADMSWINQPLASTLQRYNRDVFRNRSTSQWPSTSQVLSPSAREQLIARGRTPVRPSTGGNRRVH